MIPDACNDAQIIVDCDKRLTGLFRRSFPQAKVYGTRTAKQLAWDEADRTFDASISMGELGKFYRNDESAFPGTPYLVPCPDRTEGWRATFAAKKKPVIGIAWSGGTWENGASNRYLPLDEWAPIFKAIDAHWVSLEYKDAAKAIQGTPVVQYPWATLTKDYDDTAALVAACDLVVTMQTAVAHLAGALGVPVWVMVPSNSQWRYGESDETLPWYKSLRIFKARGSWGPVVHPNANELKGWRK
jgi:ADP-heptose:LPS heptosyltransferase